MKKTLLFSTLLLLFSSYIYSQDVKLSGKFTNTPFIEFVEKIENQTELRFFFKNEWVENIRVTTENSENELNDILKKNFPKNNLFYYIDSNYNVFITKELAIKKELPEYINTSQSLTKIPNGQKDNGLTETEKTYIKSRKKGVIPTINIGKTQSNIIEENAIIIGDIKDVETGEALVGATIFIKKLSLGTVTDVNGHFTLTLSPGKYYAKINNLGMNELVYYFNVLSSDKVSLEMEKKIIPITEVTVVSNQFHNVRGIQMGFEKISIKEIKEIPAVMGEKDVLKVVQMLPGVQNVGEGSAGLNVRGSAADQNMFYINKIPVYNTSHLFGFFSAFNPDIIKDFSFYKSNVPAKYGGKLASVFDINSRQGSTKKFTARGGISPVTARLSVETPIVKDKSSLILSARSSYSDWILGLLDNPDLRNSKASFYDLATNVNIQPNNNNIIKLFGYYSHDKFSLTSTQVYNYSNAGSSANWWHRYSSKLSSDFSAIISKYSFQHIDSAIFVEAYKQKYNIDHYEIRSDFIWIPHVDHTVTFGLNAILYDLDRGSIDPIGSYSSRERVELGTERGFESALHIADEFQLLPKLILYAGLRYSMYQYLGPQTVINYQTESPVSSVYIKDSTHYTNGEIVKSYSGPELRGSINYRTSENSSLKVSYNRTRQYLYMLSNTITFSPTDQWKLTDYYVKPATADQYSLGFYKDIVEKNINISAEVYFKNIKNLVEYKDGADFISSPNIETEVLQGNQTAYGIEFMLKKNTGKLSGWVSCSFSRSEITVNGENSWEQINNGEAFPSNYDIPVGFNTVANYRLSRRFSISTNIVYHTGRPVTYPVSSFYVEGKEYIYYSSRNDYRLPDYFRIDFSLNMEGNLIARKFKHSYWMLNIYNLTGRKNAYSVFFQAENEKINAYKLSIFGRPIVTLSWHFKLGNYASE